MPGHCAMYRCTNGWVFCEVFVVRNPNFLFVWIVCSVIQFLSSANTSLRTAWHFMTLGHLHWLCASIHKLCIARALYFWQITYAKQWILLVLMLLYEGERKGVADVTDASKFEAIAKSGCNLSSAAGIYRCVRSGCQLVQCEAVSSAEGRVWDWWKPAFPRFLVAQSTCLPHLCALISGLEWRWNWRHKWLLLGALITFFC